MTTARRLPAWLTRAKLPDAWRAGAQRFRRAGVQRWQHLSAREQRLILLLSVLGAFVLVYMVLVQPAWRAIDRHARELPSLRAQAAQVDAVVQEALALRGQRTASIAPQALSSELAASLSRAALGGEYTVSALASAGTSTWEISVSNVSAAALFDWMGNAPSQLRMTLAQAHLTRAQNTLGKPLAGKASGTVIVTGGAP